MDRLVSRAPKVSLGLPVYNGEKFLRRAMDSLLAQTFTDFEIVVCDNASQDATERICREYAARDRRVRYVRTEANGGLAANYGRVFELSSGTYFRWCAHDDYYPPTMLERCVEQLEAEPLAALCATGVQSVDETANHLETWRPEADLRTGPAHRRFHRLIWAFGKTHILYGLMRRELAARAMPLGTYLGFDRVFLAKLALLGPIVQIPDALHFYTKDSEVRAIRVDSTYIDPRNRGRLPLRTPRLAYEHARVVLGWDLRWDRRIALLLDVCARFLIKDGRRLMAELYHSARIVVGRPFRRRARSSPEVQLRTPSSPAHHETAGASVDA